MANHSLNKEIIDLDSDLSDDDISYGTPQPYSPEPPNLDQHPSDQQGEGSGPEAYQKCLDAVLAVFPDISHDHVQQLWDKSAWGALIGTDDFNHTLIERVLDGGTYPKERDRLRELKKRKRASPEAEAAKWKYADLRHDPEEYKKVAKARLMERFDWVPSRFIHEAFKQHAHYYGAFFAIDEADRKNEGATDPSFQRLKFKRSVTTAKPEQVMASLEAEGHDFEGLKEEMWNADERWQKEEDNRKAVRDRRQAKEASDEEYRRKGETMECACCFSDDNPPTDMTHCNADTPHFFCFGCAKQNAESDMTSLKYALRCMDQSRCKATFDRQEKARFLDAATIDKLERLQQQDEIRRAEMGDLESCPFCDFAAICAPPDVDRVFECQNPECMEASCRLCKEKTHVPFSCEEFKKENSIGERHAVEEARTEALVRSCKKCKVRILKEDGCNKVVCTNCYSTICDYCGEDISKTKYEHFDGEHRGHPIGKGKCPLYDASNRKEDQIEKAGKAAMEKIRKENPSLSEEDLKIKFAKVVQDQSRRQGEVPDARFLPGVPLHMLRQQIPGMPPELLAAGAGALAPIVVQHQQFHLQMLQDQAQRQRRAQMEPGEAARGALLGGRGQADRALLGYGPAMRAQVHVPAMGRPMNPARVLPPGNLGIPGMPLAPLPVGNGPAPPGIGPAGWQEQHPAPIGGPPPGVLHAPIPPHAPLPPYRPPGHREIWQPPLAPNYETRDANLQPPRPHAAVFPVLQRAQAMYDAAAEAGRQHAPRQPASQEGAPAQRLDLDLPGLGRPLRLGEPYPIPVDDDIMRMGQPYIPPVVPRRQLRMGEPYPIPVDGEIAPRTRRDQLLPELGYDDENFQAFMANMRREVLGAPEVRRSREAQRRHGVQRG